MSDSTRVATNQSPPLAGVNLYTSDRALVEAVVRHGSSEVSQGLEALGTEAGTPEAQEQAALANRFGPTLKPFDRYGNRIDEVEFHPSWHWLMSRGVGHGLGATPWVSDDPHAHVRRAGGFIAWSQTEQGHGCPISMTYAAVPALRADDALAEEWTPRLASTTYDARVCAATDKAGALAGMGMTEKQGGSDVRAMWEGSGNVNALDVLRALSREPAVLDAWIEEVGRTAGADARLDRAIRETLEMVADLSDPGAAEGGARRLAARMALCLQGALLVRHSPPQVADTFCASRLNDQAGTFGQLPLGLELPDIVERTTPTKP